MGMREKLIELLCEANSKSVDAELFEDSSYAQQLEIEADFLIDNGVTVLPCKIGDYAYAIRNYKGHIHPQRGFVSEMYFIKGMKLHVVVKNVARGEWGKTIFGTDEEAYKAIAERKNK